MSRDRESQQTLTEETELSVVLLFDDLDADDNVICSPEQSDRRYIDRFRRDEADRLELYFRWGGGKRVHVLESRDKGESAR